MGTRTSFPPAGLMSRLALGAAALALIGGVVVAVGTLDRLALITLGTLPLAALVWLHPLLGVGCVLAYSSVLALLVRLLPPANGGPIGLALDALLLLLGLRLVLDLARHRDWQRLASPLTPVVLIFAAYQALEVLNPAAPSLAFGLYGLRVTARMLVFFLVLYYVRDVRALGRLAAGWLVMLGAMGAYGIFQHHHGLLWQEMAWLLAEGNASTHILGGYVRVFSTVGDAATFGFLMMAGTLQALAGASCLRGWAAVALWSLVLPLLYAMTLSYSRGPVVALAAGFVALVVASRNWRLAAWGSALGALGLVLLVASGSTRLVDRLATATSPDQDASFNVRLGYVATYLPEIARRPFGYGINTSGGGARKLAGGVAVRGTPVGVPTDNYYFKIALELGWVGLGLWLWLVASLLRQAWRACTLARGRPLTAALAFGTFATLTALIVGALSNDIIAQKPIAEWFWLAAGLVVWLERHLASVRRRTGATPGPGRALAA